MSGAMRHALFFVARPEPGQAVTGARIGSQVVAGLLDGAFTIDWIDPGGAGLARQRGGARGLWASARAAVRALPGLVRLAWTGRAGQVPDVVYMVPAASLPGRLRTLAAIAVVRLFHPHARLVLHLRNGNYLTPPPGLAARLGRMANARADLVIALSPRLLPPGGEAQGLSRDRLLILPNTVDAPLIARTDRPPRPPGPISILYLSNFIREKGYVALLEAGEKLVDQGQGGRFALTFAGHWPDPEARRLFEVRARALSARGMNVTLAGAPQDRGAVRRLYALHDVFCLPSSYSAEAQPRSVLEAMANGCAVVATDWRAIPDMVRDGETGLLIARRDPALLAGALAGLTPERVVAMGRAGQVLFRRDFAPDRNRAQLMSALGFAPAQPCRTLREVA